MLISTPRQSASAHLLIDILVSFFKRKITICSIVFLREDGSFKKFLFLM